MTDILVTYEPRVYGPNSGASYFQDIALASLRGAGAAEANERLTRYAMELDVEILARSPEGRRAEKLALEHRSGRGSETRAATSTSILGFTTPNYLVEDYALFRSPNKSFVDQTTILPLPTHGDHVHVPTFTGAASVAQYTQNSGVAELDPSGLDIDTPVVALAGQVTISQQLFDRGGLPGEAFDKILLAQVMSQFDAAFDLYVINQALATAGTVTDSSAFTWALFLQDLASAREKLSDTAGTRLLATHIFTTSDLFGYATRQVDSENRPIVVPDSSAIVLASTLNDPKWLSWTGVHLGQARWHTDDNIPASGSNTQIIVARPEEIYTFAGPPISFAYPETYASNLSVLVGVRAYVAAVARFPKATSVISGNTYPTSLV